MSESDPSIVYSGDKAIAVEVLDYILERGAEVSALILPSETVPTASVDVGTHNDEQVRLCSHLDEDRIYRNGSFLDEKSIQSLEAIEPDYLLSINFPHIYPKEILEIPSQDSINLHPGYLPHNRGWHTASWSILKENPFGITLHVMEPEIDAGDIIARRKFEVRPHETAGDLYDRLGKTELELFKQAWPDIADKSYDKRVQNDDLGSFHTKSDLEAIQEIQEEITDVGTFLRKLRALTTHRIEDAAYFEQGGTKYRVQVDITPERESS